MSKCVLLEDNILTVNPTITPKELIQKHAGGTYTTARTINQTAIIDFVDHLGRMKSVGELAHREFSVESLEQQLVLNLKTGMSEFLRLNPTSEIRITMAISLVRDSPQFQLGLFFEPLPPVPTPPITVDVMTAERHQPSIKHVQWAVERKPLEAKMSPGSNEVILQDQQGHLYEGLSSNFFIVDSRDGKLHTAPDTMVLGGTIRKIILKICEEMSLPVVFDLPQIADQAHWSGAFISSTSRLLLPICTFRLHEPSRVDLTQTNSELIEKLRTTLKDRLQVEATQIL